MPDDQQHADELIPEVCKPLYESLINDGSRPIEPADVEADPTIALLIERGLAETALPGELRLAAVGPVAAFERLLTRWLDNTATIRRQAVTAYDQAVSVQHRLLRRSSADAREVCHIVVDKTQVAALRASLANAAEQQACYWDTGPYGETFSAEAPSATVDSEAGFARYLPPDSKLLDRGGVARCVCDAEYVRHFREIVEQGYADGENIRIRERKLPMKLLIVDDHSALVPLGPYGRPALLIRSQPLVTLFQRFFDLVWDAASPWEPDAKKRTAAKTTPVAEKVLELMAAGLKDEAIARQCGVSVKTVRRQIGHVMTELGARNRFAAGVAAVRLGRVNVTG